MARNFKEAVTEVSKESGHSEEFLLDNELVMEVEAEDDHMEFDAYEDEDGNIVKGGTPVGVEVTDGTSETFVMYDQYQIVDDPF